LSEEISKENQSPNKSSPKSIIKNPSPKHQMLDFNKWTFHPA